MDEQGTGAKVRSPTGRSIFNGFPSLCLIAFVPRVRERELNRQSGRLLRYLKRFHYDETWTAERKEKEGGGRIFPNWELGENWLTYRNDKGTTHRRYCTVIFHLELPSFPAGPYPDYSLWHLKLP